MRILTLTAALAATLGLAACEGTDLERGALGAGVVCDDVTPQLCN